MWTTTRNKNFWIILIKIKALLLSFVIQSSSYNLNFVGVYEKGLARSCVCHCVSASVFDWQGVLFKVSSKRLFILYPLPSLQHLSFLTVNFAVQPCDLSEMFSVEKKVDRCCVPRECSHIVNSERIEDTISFNLCSIISVMKIMVVGRVLAASIRMTSPLSLLMGAQLPLVPT